MNENYLLYVGLSYAAAIISVAGLCVKIYRQKKQTYQFLKNHL
jgi:heme exporter protein CcmD